METSLYKCGIIKNANRYMCEKMDQKLGRQKLNEILNSKFNESELQNLCFMLEIDYENLAGVTKLDKVREIILYCERFDKALELEKAIFSIRPNLIKETEVKDKSTNLQLSGDEGIWDISEQLDKKYALLNRSAQLLSNSLYQLALNFQYRADEIDAINAKNTKTKADYQRILTQVARDMESLTLDTRSTIKTHLEIFPDLILLHHKEASLIHSDLGEKATSAIIKRLNSVRSVREALEAGIPSSRRLYAAISRLPRYTSEITKSRKDFLEAHNTWTNLRIQAINWLKDLEENLNQLSTR